MTEIRVARASQSRDDIVAAGPPRGELKCRDYNDVIRICVAQDSPHEVRGSVTAYNGNYQTAVSLVDHDHILTPARIESAFYGALQHVAQLIKQYGPEGNAPPVTLTHQHAPAGGFRDDEE
jgi:hypothetical protein